MGGRFAAALTALTMLSALAAGTLGGQAPAGASVRSPAVAASTHEADLQAVSCPGPKLCIAVGRRALPHGQAPFSQRWNGSSWAVQEMPAPNAMDGYLVSVSCPARNDCTAVGGEARSVRQSGPLAEQWNGRRWRITQDGDPAGAKAGELTGVSCASASNCVAVGQSQGRNRDLTLSERWNGRSWTVLAGARLRRPAGFVGVNCTSRTCMAVGWIADPAQPGEVAMAEQLTKGVWRLVPTPVLTGSDLTLFYDTWCANARRCLAVGQSEEGGTTTALAEQWSGSRWTPQSLSTANQVLSGISCSSAAHCMAVGSGPTRPVSELWTGAGWTSVPTAHIPGGSADTLYQVSCPTATRCIAVGARTNGGLGAVGTSLAEEWNGSSWRVLHTATP